MKVTQGEPANFDNFATVWTKFDTQATWWISADELPPMLLELGPPLGARKNADSAKLTKFISDLNVPSHDGKHHFSEVLYCLARRIGGVSLPQSKLTEQIEDEMKEAFPAYQKDPSNIITAVQRITVFKFIERLRQRIILNKLDRHERTGEEFCGLALPGVTNEECKAAGIILRYTRRMIQNRDSIV